MRTTTPLLSIAAVTAALALAACGSSSNSSSSSGSGAGSGTSSTQTAGAGSSSSSSASGSGSAATTKLSIGVQGMQLAFTHKTLSAKAGTVQIAFTNDSGMDHNIAVQKGTSGSTIGSTPTFAKGTKTLTLHLAPGRYTYFCTVPGHRQAGMLGTLTVS